MYEKVPGGKCTSEELYITTRAECDKAAEALGATQPLITDSAKFKEFELSVDDTPFGCFVYSKNVFFNAFGDKFFSLNREYHSLCRPSGSSASAGPNRLSVIITLLTDTRDIIL